MESIHEVIRTLFEALILVMAVVYIFLQDWRATLIPLPGRACFDCRHIRRPLRAWLFNQHIDPFRGGSGHRPCG